MSHLRINVILVSAIFFLLLPGVYGLDFSMGTTNGISGASESLRLNAADDNAFASSTVASPSYYSTKMNLIGEGELNFDKTFKSLDKGEHVRLIATMSDSVYHNLGYVIEKKAEDEIRVSESLF